VGALDFSGGPFIDLRAAVRRVVAADGDEVADAHLLEGADDVVQVGVLLGGVGARGAEHGTAARIELRHLADGEGLDAAGIAVDEVRESIADTVDVEALVDGFDGDRRYHAVDARRRAAANDDGQPTAGCGTAHGRNASVRCERILS
jgi:hypothetical protein